MQNIYDYAGNIIPLAEAFDYTKYIYANTGFNFNTGLKVLYLSGDTTGMSGDVKKDMTWSFNGNTGQCTVKWQGSSSLGLVKKNYSISLKEKADWGSAWERTRWGQQKKYVLKANYNDFTHSSYMCSARLWGEVVQARGQSNVPTAMWNALNYGTVDGFPVMLVINGTYVGLYTIMTHKEIVTNANSTDGFFVVGQQTDLNHTLATSFSAHTSALNLESEADFECVNSPNEDDLSDVAQSLNNCIDVVQESGNNWETNVSTYLDVDSAFDYYIFRCLLGDRDGNTKNLGLVSYDGIKWYFTAYDLDHCFATAGVNVYHLSPEDDIYLLYKNRNRLFDLIYTYSKAELKEHYNIMRSGVLREANVFDMLANYMNDIPFELFAQEDKLWPLTPNSSTASLTQMTEWYRLRCEWSDAYINAL